MDELRYDTTLDPIALAFDIRSWDRAADLEVIKALAAEAEAKANRKALA